MRKLILIIVPFLPFLASAQTTGWTSNASTNLSAICPSFTGQTGTCSSIVSAWGGGLWDNQRSRTIVLGGGHTDYNGNEIYAVDFSNPAAPTRVLVHAPSSGSALVYPNCNNGSNNDGTPTSRHTYGGSVYFPTQDEYFLYGGGCGSAGSFQDDNWTYNPNTNTWTKLSLGATHPTTATTGSTPILAYDRVTDTAYFMEFNSPGKFWQFNPATNAWTNVANISGAPCTGSPVGGGGSGTSNNSTMDPDTRQYICAGNGNLQAINVNTFAVQNDSTAPGCSPIANGPAPGLAYDPIQKLVVAWLGGNNVIEYNPDSVTHGGVTSRTCKTVTFTGGPGAQQGVGTYNRFQYASNLGAFVLVNDMAQNVFTLRLMTPAAAAAQDFANNISAAGVVRSEAWDNASDFTPASGGGGYATGTYPSEDGVYTQMTRDTTTAMSGSSIKFAVRAGSVHPVGTNPTGYWLNQLAATDGGVSSFGENTDLYFRFSVRVDSPMITYDWGTNIGGQGWKVFIVWGPVPGQSCTSDQFVQENTNQKNILSGYVSCGAPSLVDNLEQTPFNYQQSSGTDPPNYICPRSLNPNYTQPPCKDYIANEWLTEYWHVHIGTWGGNNSSFDAWASVNGSPMRQWLHLPNFNTGGGGWGDAADHTVKLGGIIFQPYFSSSLGTNTTSPAANMWVDSLIVSTQPIASPFSPPATGGSVSQVATPTLSLPGGSYTSVQLVTLSTATGGATLCYTTDGSTPTANGSGTCTHGSVYSSPIMLVQPTTISVVGTESGFSDSAAATGVFTVKPASPATAIFGMGGNK